MSDLVLSTGEIPKSFLAVEPGDGFRAFEMPLDIRVNLKDGAGKFSCAGVEIGDAIQFIPLNWRERIGIRPSEEYSAPVNFLEMVIIPTDSKTVSSLALNQTNYKDLLSKLTYFAAQGVPAAALVVKATTKSVKGKRGKFYVLDFEVRPNDPEQVKELIQFASTNEHIFDMFRSLPDIDLV